VHGIVIGKVLSAFKKLDDNGIRVCILPGTHDVYNDESIYRFVNFSPNVTVFTPEHDHEIYKDLDLAVYGKAFDGKSYSESPIKGLLIVKDVTFHIGMAHCAIRIPGKIEQETMLLDRSEIADSGFDYLALGHWHSFQDFSQGDTRAFYCGSPEPISMDQKGAGNVVMIDIQEKGDVKVTPLRVGTKEFDQISIDVGLFKSVGEIVKLIEDKANPDLILKVTLEGLCSTDYNPDSKEIEDLLGKQFFCLRVEEKWHPKLDEVTTENFPEETVTGKFIKLMQEKVKSANNIEDKTVYEEALKLGFALLQGHPEVME
jgi:exonuclease SbcD